MGNARALEPDTVRTRIALGFPTRDAWCAAPATFTEHTLTIESHPVMEDWEDSYMRELATIAGSRGGAVLEVGFGMGISASYLQTLPLTQHLIIEANREVFTELVRFAERARTPVTPLFGFWEEVVHTLPSASLDGILFDTYPLTKEEVHRNHFPFFPEAYRLLRPGGVLTYYSDEARDYAPEHRTRLQAAGFTRIAKRVCSVLPPPDCAYWKHDTLMAPLVWK